MPKLVFAILLTATTAATGCGGLGVTNWASPGTAQVQQKRAERFDPYPQAVFGSSETVGTRPRDYDRPALDPVPANPWPSQQIIVPQ